MPMKRRAPLLLINLLLSLLLMTLLSFLPTTPTTNHQHKTKKKFKKKKKKKTPPPLPSTTPSPPSSWEQFKNLLSCKTSAAAAQVHDPTSTTKYNRLSSTCGASICALRDVVHRDTRVTDHSSSSDDRCSRRETALSSRPSGMQFRRLSGCYECHAVDAAAATRYPRPRTLCPCAECGEVFTKPEGLEIHQAIRHAVSELGPEDSGRNIVEIIFKSSWQKKDSPICKIDRILKVHNTQRTIARFEDYRNSVKSGAGAGALHHHRCAADGNELLRFHCTSLSCALGANSGTSLCLSSSSSLPCGVCTVIRYGFSRAHQTHTSASSGRAHDWGPPQLGGGGQRAMLVCRVIAGRVRRRRGEDAAAAAAEEEGGGTYDSVAGEGGGSCYSNLEELFVGNPRAILPCFVVIYRALD